MKYPNDPKATKHLKDVQFGSRAQEASNAIRAVEPENYAADMSLEALYTASENNITGKTVSQDQKEKMPYGHY